MKKNQLVIIALALLAAACSPKVEERGYVKNADWAGVTPGQTTKDELIAAFGSPSSIADFGEETWYYIHSRKETVAFLAPEIADQGVVRVRFDENGVVSQVENYSKEQAKDFELAKRITPTEGHQLGFFEQIIGNIGRFNKPGDTGVAGGRAPSGY